SAPRDGRLIDDHPGHSEARGAFRPRGLHLSVRFTASPCPPSRLAACLRRLGQQRACVVYPASGLPSSPWSAARLLRLLRLRTGLPPGRSSSTGRHRTTGHAGLPEWPTPPPPAVAAPAWRAWHPDDARPARLARCRGRHPGPPSPLPPRAPARPPRPAG